MDELKARVVRLLPPPLPLKQGAHLDPLDPSHADPDPDRWPDWRVRAYASPEMERFREGLRLPSQHDVRAAVLDDLSTYFGLSPDECVRRCVDWEAWSVEEWAAGDRSTREGIVEFYRSTESWAFDLLWYAYLQAEGDAVPESVVAVRFAERHAPRGRHLDFGSGVGVTSELFGRCGFETDLADISTSLLRFSRFRLERRGIVAGYVDLNESGLETGRYDVITAVDTLSHVPDVAETAAMLHRALRPGGWLITNFDVRPPSVENAWHLYDDDLALRYVTQRSGFEPRGHAGELIAYRRVETETAAHQLRSLRDRVVLTSRSRRLARRVARQAAGVLYQRMHHAEATG